MTKKKEESEKKYKKNYLTCLSCEKVFHRPKSLCKSKNNFCSIECKSKGMCDGLTNPMRKGTGKYDKETPIIRRKYYKYKRFDNDNFNSKLDYTIDNFIEFIKDGQCTYCGDNSNKLGFDRIDNNLGHILNNVVVCCEICNMTRGNRFTYEEMIQIGQIIKKIKKDKI